MIPATNALEQALGAAIVEPARTGEFLRRVLTDELLVPTETGPDGQDRLAMFAYQGFHYVVAFTSRSMAEGVAWQASAWRTMSGRRFLEAAGGHPVVLNPTSYGRLFSAEEVGLLLEGGAPEHDIVTVPAKGPMLRAALIDVPSTLVEGIVRACRRHRFVRAAWLTGVAQAGDALHPLVIVEAKVPLDRVAQAIRAALPGRMGPYADIDFMVVAPGEEPADAFLIYRRDRSLFGFG